MNRFVLVFVAVFGLLGFVNLPSAQAGCCGGTRIARDVLRTGARMGEKVLDNEIHKDRQEQDHHHREEHYENRSRQRINERREATNDRIRYNESNSQIRMNEREQAIDHRGRAIDQDVNAKLTLGDPLWQDARNARQNSEVARFGGDPSPPQYASHPTSTSTAAASSYGPTDQKPLHKPSAAQLRAQGFGRSGSFKTFEQPLPRPAHAVTVDRGPIGMPDGPVTIPELFALNELKREFVEENQDHPDRALLEQQIDELSAVSRSLIEK